MHMSWKEKLERVAEPSFPDKTDWNIASVGSGDIVEKCHQAAYRKVGFHTEAIFSRKREKAQRVADHYEIPKVYTDWEKMLEDPAIDIVDIALPPHMQLEVVRKCCRENDHIRGILCQKPAAMCAKDAVEIGRLCREAGITVAVNHNMRFDQSIRALKYTLEEGLLGKPVLATIEMRARSEWQRFYEQYGMLEIFNMGIHHIDTIRHLFGDPEKITAVYSRDPQVDFPHNDGFSQYNLIYPEGFFASVLDDDFAGPKEETGCAQDIYIKWRVEGTDGQAQGTIGWPFFPERIPSMFRITSKKIGRGWVTPMWETTWFPDAFAGTMADLLIAVENGAQPSIRPEDSAKTLACVEACYRSAKEERTIYLKETDPLQQL